MSNKLFLIIALNVFIGTKNFSQVAFTSSNLPIIIINTHGQTIPDDPKITADMGIIDNGAGIINKISDSFNGYNGKIGIEIRGHSSQSFPKKQYGIELRDSSGNDIKAPLLGFPEEGDWVLNASYTDKTFLRNVIAYKLSNDLGRYASRTRYCEVVLNGDYIGIYILQEKIKRDKNRVNIKKMSSLDNLGDAVTGGYILKVDRVDPGDKYWTSVYPSITGSAKSPVNYLYEYPKAEEITSEQQNYLYNYINKFETIMYSVSYKDPFAGYYNFIDIDSFVDYFLLNEFSKNTDAYRLSTFFFKNRESEGGKLNMGPVWDFDISFGMADYDDGFNPEGWQVLKQNDGLWNNPFWTSKLIADPVFKNKLAKRWNDVKNTFFSINALSNLIDENSLLISEARVRNFSKWKILGSYVWPEYFFPNTYEEEITYLKNWISKRTDWLNKNLPSNYSDVEWLSPDLSQINFSTANEIKIPLSSFVKSKINVTSLNFMTLDLNCIPELKGDTLYIKILKKGSYLMKGVGRKDSEIISISPNYMIEATHTFVEFINSEIPGSFQLNQNYPNPFNPETVISYQLPVSGFVSLKIYDMLGSEVSTLVNEYKQAGMHQSTFNTLHSSLTSGIYFYKLVAGGSAQIKKMVLMK